MMKTITCLFICCIGILAILASKSQAASFDCAKAQLPAEKFVCDNPFISELDDKLDAIYKSVLAKANETEKQAVIAQQEHWLKHTRNLCRREVCFKHAYWSRQAELATFFEPKSPLYAKEADKAQAIQKVLAEAPLYESTWTDLSMCRQLFADLKKMRGITFVDPVVQTMSYEDPALDPWKRRALVSTWKKCSRNAPLTFSYTCTPPVRRGWIDVDSHLMNCNAGYGLPPFKIFELPPLKPSEKTRYFFYADYDYGPMNQKYITWAPIMGGGYNAGFHEFSLGECGKRGTETYAGIDAHGPPNYNSIIIYKQRYFLLVLEHYIGNFWLSIRPVDKKEICRWSPQIN